MPKSISQSSTELVAGGEPPQAISFRSVFQEIKNGSVTAFVGYRAFYFCVTGREQHLIHILMSVYKKFMRAMKSYFSFVISATGYSAVANGKRITAHA